MISCIQPDLSLSWHLFAPTAQNIHDSIHDTTPAKNSVSVLAMRLSPMKDAKASSGTTTQNMIHQPVRLTRPLRNPNKKINTCLAMTPTSKEKPSAHLLDDVRTHASTYFSALKPRY